MNVVEFKPRRHLSQNRDRDSVLSVLVPKMLGLIWDKAERDPRFGLCAIIDGNIAIGAQKIAWGAYVLHVYLFEGDAAKKVLSLHIGDRSIAGGDFKYFEGRCAVLSWRRGEWEDRIAALHCSSRSVPHLTTAGITRRQV